MKPPEAALRENVRALYDACLNALQYLEQSPARGGRAWREVRDELRRAILAAGGDLPDARESGEDAWQRLRR
jgi:hypothetical protein